MKSIIIKRTKSQRNSFSFCAISRYCFDKCALNHLSNVQVRTSKTEWGTAIFVNSRRLGRPSLYALPIYLEVDAANEAGVRVNRTAV